MCHVQFLFIKLEHVFIRRPPPTAQQVPKISLLNRQSSREPERGHITTDRPRLRLTQLLDTCVSTRAMLLSDPAARLSVPHAGSRLLNRSRHQIGSGAINQHASLRHDVASSTQCFHYAVLPNHPRHQTHQNAGMSCVQKLAAPSNGYQGRKRGHICTHVSSTQDSRLMAG